MLDFKTTQTLKPNTEILETIKDYTYKIKKGSIKHILHIEITRDSNYNIDIKNIKFTDEFITKSSKSYLKYLNEILIDNNIGIKYQEEIDEEKLKKIELDYDILSLRKIKNNKYSNEFIEDFISKSHEHFYVDGIISCQYMEGNAIKDVLLLVPKKDIRVAN